MPKKIKLLWDFRGPEAFKIAEHHCIHLREYAEKEKIQVKPRLTQGLLKYIRKKEKLFLKFKNEKFKNKEGNTYQQYKIYNDKINKLKKNKQ